MDKKEQTISVFKAMNAKEFDQFENNITDDIRLDFPGTEIIEGGKRIILFFKILLTKYCLVGAIRYI